MNQEQNEIDGTKGKGEAGNFRIFSKDIIDCRLDPKHFLSSSPNDFGCCGKNISPHLAWNCPPSGTKSFVLMVKDRDAPTGMGWIHWVVINIPAAVRELRQGILADGAGLPAEAIQTRTDFGTLGYGGPCPPVLPDKHNYDFTLFALNIEKIPEANANMMPAFVAFHALKNAMGMATLTLTQGREQCKAPAAEKKE